MSCWTAAPAFFATPSPAPAPMPTLSPSRCGRCDCWRRGADAHFLLGRAADAKPLHTFAGRRSLTPIILALQPGFLRGEGGRGGVEAVPAGAAIAGFQIARIQGAVVHQHQVFAFLVIGNAGRDDGAAAPQ